MFRSIKVDLASAAQQSLAADGAVACFSTSLLLRGLNAVRAPQLKAIYKASQEKKSVLIRGVPNGFCFLPASTQ
jgi:hypothetical protein